MPAHPAAVDLLPLPSTLLPLPSSCCHCRRPAATAVDPARPALSLLAPGPLIIGAATYIATPDGHTAWCVYPNGLPGWQEDASVSCLAGWLADCQLPALARHSLQSAPGAASSVGSASSAHPVQCLRGAACMPSVPGAAFSVPQQQLVAHPHTHAPAALPCRQWPPCAGHLAVRCGSNLPPAPVRGDRWVGTGDVCAGCVCTGCARTRSACMRPVCTGCS